MFCTGWKHLTKKLQGSHAQIAEGKPRLLQWKQQSSLGKSNIVGQVMCKLMIKISGQLAVQIKDPHLAVNMLECFVTLGDIKMLEIRLDGLPSFL